MKCPRSASMGVGIVVLSAFVFAAAAPAGAQGQLNLTEEQARARARAIARAMEENARELTLFDRQGNVTGIIGEPGLYNQPVFSPDRTRLAVIKIDLDKETNNLWVLDLATGREVQITSSGPRQPVSAPVWSPDGRQIAYVALRDSYFSAFRQASNGQGEAELLYQHPGGQFILTDWSLDGRFLSFSAADLSGGRLYVLPVDGDRQVVEVARSESQILAPRMSPDGRFLAYRSNETGRNEIFVRAVPPPGDPGASVEKWQVSTDGGLGMVFWRRDGKELYYLGPDRSVMAAQVDTDQGFEFGPPQPLFALPDSIPVTGTPGGLGNVSRDGERVVFAVPPAPRLQQITLFDRAGKVVSRVGEPGQFGPLALSPDGSRIAAVRANRQTGTVDLWALDVSTGAATQVTSNEFGENSPTWSADGRHLAYVSMRETRAGLYRKASNGTGDEELLFRYEPGAGMALTDVSADGRYAAVDGGGFVLMVPLTGTGDPSTREAIEFSREEFEVGLGRFSPDSRFVAYGSNETDRFEVYVRPFDAATGQAIGDQKWQISRDGAAGGIFWREDGQELYFLSDDIDTDELKVMAVEVTTTPAFQAGAPRELFRLPGPVGGQGQYISPDGERFVFAVRLPR